MGAIEIARVEKDDPGLGCVLLEPDGTVAAVNQWALYAAMPVSLAIVKSLPIKEADTPIKDPCAISISQLTNLCKAIPIDRQFRGMLEHVSIRQDGQFVDCEFNDGKAIVRQRLRCSKPVATLTTWKSRLAGLTSGQPSETAKFVYNRARLVSVVAAIEASCKYSGEFAFISQDQFPLGYIWKSINELTGQTVICAHVLPSVAKMPDKSEWEKSIFKSKIVLNKRSR
jgi:hypothetical protein